MPQRPRDASSKDLSGMGSRSSLSSRSSKFIDAVQQSRSSPDYDSEDDDHMKNMAYIVSSASDNIHSLQKCAKQQEKELKDKNEQIIALQRNYETLSRIRQADNKEFALLKAQQKFDAENQAQMKQQIISYQEKVAALEEEVSENAAARSELMRLRMEVEELTRIRDQAQAEALNAQRVSNDLRDANKVLKLNADKLMRQQHEQMQRVRETESECSNLNQQKDEMETRLSAASMKNAQQEKQLRTFLEANEALESDVRTFMNQQMELQRKLQEVEFEKQTIEAYYIAKHEEMQNQFNKLLASRQ